MVSLIAAPDGLAHRVLADSLPAPLTGEQLASLPQDVSVVDLACAPYGSPGPATIVFHAIGQATGPYVGTFEATSQLTVNRGAFGANVVMFHSDLRITSVSGNIVSTEDLLTPTDGIADCYHSRLMGAPVSFTYAATISTAQGIYAARGTGSGNIFYGYLQPKEFDQIFATGTTFFDAANISPPSLGFGSVWVGTASVVQLVALSNVGSRAIHIKSIDIVGPDSGDYTQSDTCPDTLGPTESCAISVQFTPSHIGLHSAAIAMNMRPEPDSTDSSHMGLIPMVGMGYGSTLSLSPADVLQFADTPVGTASGVGTVVVTSTGPSPALITSVTVAGTSASSFQISDLCSGLRNLHTCYVSVRFSPTAAGYFEASLVVVSNALSSPDSIVLAGTGT